MESYNTYDDLSLLGFIKQGDELAFGEIYERYWQKLFKYVYNRMHVRESSEEVVQEVFYTLWDKRDSISITSSLSAYLFIATKHKLLNEMRSRQVANTYAQDLAMFMKRYLDNSNEEWQNLVDLENAVEDCLTDLPPKCQTVFRMSRQQHLPIPRIAAQLDISSKTVENYLTQALKHLRITLGEFLPTLIFLFCNIN